MRGSGWCESQGEWLVRVTRGVAGEGHKGSGW